MLWTIAVLCSGLWLVGLQTSYAMGGVIHALLALAAIAIFIQVVETRRRY